LQQAGVTPGVVAVQYSPGLAQKRAAKGFRFARKEREERSSQI
jgi:hypothetical protein